MAVARVACGLAGQAESMLAKKEIKALGLLSVKAPLDDDDVPYCPDDWLSGRGLFLSASSAACGGRQRGRAEICSNHAAELLGTSR